MKLRFSIRDLLWLTLVVALAVGWSATNGTLTEQIDANNAAITNLEVKCNKLNGEVEFLKSQLTELREDHF